MKNSVKIWLDLDGTVYDLYNINNWKPRLEAEDPTVFEEGGFIGDYDRFISICNKLVSIGVQFGVITWLSMQSSVEYEIECTKVKRSWVNKFMPFVTEFNAQSYGTPKQNAIQKRAKTMYLLDDNKDVCEMWWAEETRRAINVNCNGLTTIEALEKIYRDLTR